MLASLSVFGSIIASPLVRKTSGLLDLLCATKHGILCGLSCHQNFPVHLFKFTGYISRIEITHYYCVDTCRFFDSPKHILILLFVSTWSNVLYFIGTDVLPNSAVVYRTVLHENFSTIVYLTIGSMTNPTPPTPLQGPLLSRPIAPW